jgi:hypothetical protein
MTRILLALTVAALFFSCEPKQIDYDRPVDTTFVVDDRINNTTKVMVAELPIKFDSTDVLLFAVELVDLEQRGFNHVGSNFYSYSKLEGSYMNNDDFSGDFINIVFQDKDGHERKLTDKKMKIQSIHFLRGIATKTKSRYLLYSVLDIDSNGDLELNASDLEALYISRIDGSGFTKLTRALHELYDWNTFKGEGKIYFRTLEDRNKDGKLTNKDKFHHYFVDFSNDPYSVTEYNPLKVFE